MDDQARIAKLEAEMESMRESNIRLERSVDLLHGELEKLRDRFGSRIDGLRECFDKRLAEERAWSDASFKETRAGIEHGFAECRTEAKITRRWLIGLVVSAIVGVAGIAAKLLFGA